MLSAQRTLSYPYDVGQSWAAHVLFEWTLPADMLLTADGGQRFNELGELFLLEV